MQKSPYFLEFSLSAPPPSTWPSLPRLLFAHLSRKFLSCFLQPISPWGHLTGSYLWSRLYFKSDFFPQGLKILRLLHSKMKKKMKKKRGRGRRRRRKRRRKRGEGGRRRGGGGQGLQWGWRGRMKGRGEERGSGGKEMEKLPRNFLSPTIPSNKPHFLPFITYQWFTNADHGLASSKSPMKTQFPRSIS